jgi:hypothetical protein
VLAGLCSFTDITESRVDLADVALMNELLDIRAVNDRRLNQVQQQPDPDVVTPPTRNPFMR